MLQTIRDYATEQLNSAEELSAPVRRAHAEHYTERALELHRAVYEKERSLALSAMEDELGNVRTAWDYWLLNREVDRLHELLEPLWGFHEARGDYAAAIALGEDLLDALAREPPTPARAHLEYALHLSVVRATVAARGFTPDAERRMREALEQSEIVGDERRRFTTLRSLVTLHMIQRDFAEAAETARDLVALAQDQQDTTMLSESHLVAGTVSVWLEGWDEGLAHIETAIQSFSPRPPSSAQFRVGPHPEVVSHALAGLVQWQVGFPDQAVRESARALELAAELAHPYSISYALFHAALLDLWRSDWTAVAARADDLVEMADAHDYAVWRALGIVMRGTAMVGIGDSDAGLAEVSRGFSLYHGLSTPPVFWPHMLLIRAQAFAMAGRREDALACVQEAQDCVGDDDPLSAEVAIMRGDLLMGEPSPDVAAGAALFEKAASMAAARGARISELGAATRLLEAARETQRESQARDRVRDLLDTFTEGFSAPPLVAARAALERST
jgi:tetratricopeptide (TPR) repeat protein